MLNQTLKYFETLIQEHKKFLVIDDCISELKMMPVDKIKFINPFGKTKTEVVNAIVKKNKDYLPVIGATIKYNENTKRSSYEGIKLLLEISEHYPNEQIFFVISFEEGKALKEKEFGYIFNASNIKLISYNELLNN
ncbi:MAG: hypothetical protein ABJB11_12540 [Ferruginibacter sp.]